jgi:fatty-acyl-CoA synthase
MQCPTPAISASLALSPGPFNTLVDGLEYAAKGETGFNYFSVRGELLASLPYATLRERAISVAGKLLSLGLPPGDRVILLIDTSVDFHILFFACQYASLIPVPMPLPMNLGGREAYVRHVRAMIHSAEPSVAVAPEELQDVLLEAMSGSEPLFTGTQAAIYALPEFDQLRPAGRGDSCYIQYSSGSTSAPKGVAVSQEAVTKNAHAIISHGLQVTEGDRCTSWLPLFHDMGLVGFCIAPLLAQLSTDYITASDFARRPLAWLEMISKYRGTLAFSPSFGYELCVRRAVNNGAPAEFDLSSWRVAGIGGDMVRANVAERFAERFGAMEFRRSAFLPSYGLAESTLAVSFAPLDEGISIDRVDLNEFARTKKAVPAAPEASSEHTRSFVLCGKPLPNHELRIVDSAGNELADRRVGRVMVRGPSVMAGYFQDSEATSRVLSDDGWLETGDLGYTIDGSLVITGRSKDLIICNGRNIWPQDIEWAVERLPGMRSGDVAAFSVDGADGAERIVTIVQCRVSTDEARAKLQDDVGTVVRKMAGVDCTVVLTKPRSIPVTSSGKISRSAAKAQFLSGVYSTPAT